MTAMTLTPPAIEPVADTTAVRLATIYGAIGLAGNPFPADPEAGAFVSIPQHASASAALGTWLEDGPGSGLALVTGEPGSGRTRLMLRLAEALSSRPSRSRVVVATVRGASERRTDSRLLRAIAEALGAEATGRTGLELTTSIRGRLERTRDAGLTTAILIDDAAFAGSQLEIVRSLLPETGVRVVLFGPPELRERVARRRSLAGSLRQAVALGAMDEAVIAGFLASRIEPVRQGEGGREGLRRREDELFTPDAVAIIARWSAGNPGAVVRIAGECLLEAIASSQPVVDGSVAHRVARELTDRARNEARRIAEAPFREPAVQTRLPLEIRHGART